MKRWTTKEIIEHGSINGMVEWFRAEEIIDRVHEARLIAAKKGYVEAIALCHVLVDELSHNVEDEKS